MTLPDLASQQPVLLSVESSPAIATQAEAGSDAGSE